MIELVPVWLQVVVAAAAVATAGWTLYRKVAKPIALLIVLLDDALPIIDGLIDVMAGENGHDGLRKHFDRVERIDSRVERIDTRVQNIDGRLTVVEGEVA